MNFTDERKNYRSTISPKTKLEQKLPFLLFIHEIHQKKRVFNKTITVQTLHNPLQHVKTSMHTTNNN